MTSPVAFLDAAVERLQAPIAAYFDAMDGVDPKTPRGRIAQTRAIVAARDGFRRALSEMFDAALVLSQAAIDAQARRTLQQLKAEQFAYAIGFMEALPTLTRDAALLRASLYVQAINRAFSQFVAADMPELPQTPGDGQTECTWHCRCYLVKKQVGPRDWDITWMLTLVAEHCDDCIRLSREWAPLQIRNGAIVGTKAISLEDLRMVSRLIGIAVRAPRAELDQIAL